MHNPQGGNILQNEFCPKCGAVRNTQASETIANDKKKKNVFVVIKSYFCEVCNTFIRSEKG